MKQARSLVIFVLLTVGCGRARPAIGQPKMSLVNGAGVSIEVAEEHANPAVWVNVPDEPDGHHAVLVLLPEHVTVRRHNAKDAEHLYIWSDRAGGARPHWNRSGDALEYTKDLSTGLQLLGRVTAHLDGLLLHYEFRNETDTDFDSVQAISDPRMVSRLLHDVRLERTYVHGPDGFTLLASDMPERLTMPLNVWLPNRYRISYAWPVETTRIQPQPDGIRFINAPRQTDEPVLATVSSDRRWVMATFSRNPGNLWTNPELTCQHADPDITTPRHTTGIVEEKILLFRGTLDDVIVRVHEERQGLR